MRKPSVLRDKSLQFGIIIVDLTRRLREANVEYSLYNQLLKSGTAVGALIREAEFAQSRADFISKLSIALKEANETVYWLDLLADSYKGNKSLSNHAKNLIQEIVRMLVSSLNTAKRLREK